MADAEEVNEAHHRRRESFTVDGNRLTVQADGAERLHDLLELIAGAKTSLRILYYIFTDDHAGRQVRDALADALRRGCEVRLIVDGFGSPLPADYFNGLHEGGADVCRFLPRFGRRYLLRNHQKLALADDARAIIGGFNVADDYFDDRTGWRDLGLLVEGPAARHIAGYFDALARWTHQDKARIRDLRRTITHWSQRREGGKVRWLLGGPTRRLSPWAQALRHDVERARKVDMIAGYFAPSLGMMRRIERVTKNGGAVRVLTPAHTDHQAAVAAARHTFTRLLKRGVRIFEYQKQKLHTKLFVVDETVHAGSANFDIRSMFLNLEIMLRVEDQAFADHMRGYFEGELKDAKEVSAEEHAKASWLDRIRWSAAYFIMAVVDANVTRRLNFGVDGK